MTDIKKLQVMEKDKIIFDKHYQNSFTNLSI